MKPSFTRLNTSNGVIHHPSPSTPASLSPFSESLEYEKTEVSGIVLDTPSTCGEDIRGLAAGTETVSERPVVPSGPADWEARKQTIWELYMDQNMILNEVIEIMLTKHKFKATYLEHLDPTKETSRR
jgi:hypothetical protein